MLRFPSQWLACFVLGAFLSGLCACSSTVELDSARPPEVSDGKVADKQNEAEEEDAPPAFEPEVKIVEVIPEDALVPSDYDPRTAKAIQASADGAELVGEEYAINIPADLEDQLFIVYESGYADAGSGSGSGQIFSGYHARINRFGAEWSQNEELGYVVVMSDTWGPQTDMDTIDLGHPSNMPDATVWLMQIAGTEPSLDEIASWITVF